VNHLLLPNGQLSSDIAAMLSAAKAAETLIVDEIDRGHAAAMAQPEARRPDALAAAAIAADRLRQLYPTRRDIRQHLAEDRFLFILGDHGLPIIYFQCAVAGNLDVDFGAKVPRRPVRGRGKGGRALGLMLLCLLAEHLWSATYHGVLLLPWLTIDYKDSTGNYALDQLYDTKFPAGSLLNVRTGAPAGANNSAGGSLLAQITTPGSPWGAAAAKSKAKQNTWSVAATGTGTGGHYRLTNAADTEREEGTITATGGGGDMTLDNTSIATGQTVSVGTFTRTS
jgi:hypothetical protein